jgi:hypothetical protein
VSGRTAIEIREITPDETALAHHAMRALRPAHEDLDAFVERIDRQQRPEGYRLVGAFTTDGGRAAAVAVAGFRTGHNLAWGHFLYVDDLSTPRRLDVAAVPARSSNGSLRRRGVSAAMSSTSTRGRARIASTRTGST